MSTPKKVHAAIEASRSAADFSVSEDPGHLRIAGSLTRAALDAWQLVQDDQARWLEIECIDASQDHISPREAQDGSRVRLNLRFEASTGAPHLFTIEGWRSILLHDEVVALADTVRLAFEVAPFSTKSFSVEMWDEAPISLPEKTYPMESGPRRYVRCQSSELMAPIRIEPWVVSTYPSIEGQAWQVWKATAATMIARSLPNELYRELDVDRVALSGQPPRRLDLGRFEESIVGLEALQDAANWVYVEGTDVEVRHTFLSTELSREWAPGRSFCEALNSRLLQSLDSARLLYKAHLRAGSKDTLKALADLRKTLADDVQKLTQQARDLSSGVWRDVAVAIGVMAIRFAIESAKASATSIAFATLYLVVAAYIGVSYAITISTNRRFLRAADENRGVWRSKLYAFLDQADYQSLAEKPISQAEEAYRVTERHTTLIIAIVIIALVGLALIEMHWLSWENVASTATVSWNWFGRLFCE